MSEINKVSFNASLVIRPLGGKYNKVALFDKTQPRIRFISNLDKLDLLEWLNIYIINR